VRKTIESRCERTFWEKLEVVPATLGNDAGIIGAAALALESEFLPGGDSAVPQSANERTR
ncbi:hypothetical protein ACQ7B2_02260, partial [Escherichia coli]